MSCITRCVLRWGMIGALAAGGLTLLVGPQRVATGFAQLREKAQGVVDSCVDDPVALRRQLEQLADEYPDRIAEVRGEIAEVEHQIAQLDRDVAIASRVVAYTGEDLNVLKDRIVRAKAEAEATVRPVYIRFEGVRFDIDSAYAEAVRIGEVRKNYRDRLAMDQQQMQMLQEQKARLHDVLAKLDDDFNTYQAQLWSLDRQIDAIQRNDRLIELMEEQQETLASYDRYERVGNLQQVEAKLAELRSVQAAKIDALSKRTSRNDYESKARLEMEEQELADPFEDLLEDELEPTDAEQAPNGDGRSMAWVDPEPIVVE